MDFDAESSSTEAAAASRTVNEAAVGVPQNVADNAAARDEEALRVGMALVCSATTTVAPHAGRAFAVPGRC